MPGGGAWGRSCHANVSLELWSHWSGIIRIIGLDKKYQVITTKMCVCVWGGRQLIATRSQGLAQSSIVVAPLKSIPCNSPLRLSQATSRLTPSQATPLISPGHAPAPSSTPEFLRSAPSLCYRSTSSRLSSDRALQCNEPYFSAPPFTCATQPWLVTTSASSPPARGFPTRPFQTRPRPTPATHPAGAAPPPCCCALRLLPPHS